MIVLYRAISKWWYARCRRIDLDILWPICRKGANDIDHAMAAFATHCFNDPAWLDLGEDELIRRMDALRGRNTSRPYR